MQPLFVAEITGKCGCERSVIVDRVMKTMHFMLLHLNVAVTIIIYRICYGGIYVYRYVNNIH